MLSLAFGIAGAAAIVLTVVALFWGMWRWPVEVEGPGEIALVTAWNSPAGQKQRRFAGKLAGVLVQHYRDSLRGDPAADDRLVWPGGDEQDLSRWISSWLGTDVVLCLTATRSTELVHAGIDQFTQMSGACVMYHWHGEPVTCFVLKPSRRTPRLDAIARENDPWNEQVHGREVLVWNRGSLLLALVADLPPDRLKKLQDRLNHGAVRPEKPTKRLTLHVPAVPEVAASVHWRRNGHTPVRRLQRLEKAAV